MFSTPIYYPIYYSTFLRKLNKMSTFCSNCDGQFDIAFCYRDEIPVCPACRAASGPIIACPSVIPPSLEVIPGKNFDQKEFQAPLMALRQDIGCWAVCDHRQNKIEIEPFDPKMMRKVFIAQHSSDDDDHEWVLVIDRYDTVCVFFKAYCATPDFTCQSGGSVSVADDFETFWDECLDVDTKKQLSIEADQIPGEMVMIGQVSPLIY